MCIRDRPYTATFRVSKPGKYTLKVTFGQQKYDGSSWKDTGTQSESTVTFTVSQAAVLTATPSPAVTQTNQKSAVQTGDSTPIMTFVIILIVAVVCIEMCIRDRLLKAKGYDSYQFVRNGFFCADIHDSRAGAPVFNRIVSLKRSFKLPKA